MVSATSGEQAISLVKEDIKANKGKSCSFDLIFMDCNMPLMDGYETTKRIREYIFDAELDQPIISAVTGHSEQLYIEKAINFGMN